MNHPRPRHAARFTVLGLLAVLTAPLAAQVEVRLATPKRELVAFERVMVDVTITNRSGRAILLARPGGGDDPWLSFEVTRENGAMVHPSGPFRALEPMQLRPGQSIARSLDLGLLFPLSDFGAYSLKAQVWVPPDGAWAASNPVRINVVSARTVWQQVFGVPEGVEGAGTSRIFKLLNLRQDDATELYVQIQDRNSGMVRACFPIGKIMDTRTPYCGLDPAGNLHVLFTISPEVAQHVVVDPGGHPLGTTLYREDRANRPTLRQGPDGSLGITGAARYDPDLEVMQRLVVRKLSDRPPELTAMLGARAAAAAAPAAPAAPPPDAAAPTVPADRTYSPLVPRKPR
jgi:hypothetical protein